MYPSGHASITTDLIASLSEKTVVFVLAHELSHYYRSHISEAKLERYEFWYDNEPDRKKRPVKSAASAELKAAYLELVRTAMQHAPTGKGVSFYNQEPLSEFLGALDASARKLDAREAKLIADLQSNRIGLYTTEQEADELGFELSLRVGLTPNEVLGGWLEFSVAVDGMIPEYYREEYNKQNGFDTATCKAALEKSFATTNAEGVTATMFVPIGRLEESHHGNCYRLFNMWRLQQSKKLVPAEAPAEMQPPWTEIQAMAKLSSPPY